MVKNNIISMWGRLAETWGKTADYDLDYVDPGSGDKVARRNGTDNYSFSAFRSGTGQEPSGL